jgi:hypothetical protein
MTTLTWPQAIVPATVTWHLEANTATYISPLTRAAQTTEMAGSRWVVDITLPPMQSAAWRTLTAFVARMRGQAGRAYVSPWHSPGSSAPTYGAGLDLTCDSTAKKADSSTPRADERYPTTLGTPVVYGAGQSGGSLVTSGWSPSAYAFKAGDLFHYDTTLGRTLHMVLDDIEADAFGRATLTIEPPIRTAPANAAALTIVNPSCVMRLKDNQAGAVSFQPGRWGRGALSMIETF